RFGYRATRDVSRCEGPIPVEPSSGQFLGGAGVAHLSSQHVRRKLHGDGTLWRRGVCRISSRRSVECRSSLLVDAVGRMADYPLSAIQRGGAVLGITLPLEHDVGAARRGDRDGKPQSSAGQLCRTSGGPRVESPLFVL